MKRCPQLPENKWTRELVESLRPWIKWAHKIVGTPAVGGGEAHSHAIADVTGLQTALNGKQPAGAYAASNHDHAGVYDPAGSASSALTSALAADFSGDYDDLTNKPVLFDGAYSSLTGVPGTFAPSAHNQAISTITGLQAALDSKGTSNFSGAYADLTGKPTLGTAAAKNVGTGANDVAAGDHTHPGGSDPWTIVALASDFTTTSNAAQNVTGLEFTPAANGRYMFEAVIGIRTATATVNPRVGLAWATGMTDGLAQIDESQSATARLMSNGNINASLLVAVGGIPNTTQSWPVTVWGWVKAGASPSGNVRIQLASETNGTTVRVMANSYLRYRSY